MTAPLSPEDRALIVRALRGEADRIASGGDVWAIYSTGQDGPDWEISVAEARRVSAREFSAAEDESGDGWPEHVESIGWGILVDVESAHPVSRRESCDDRFSEIVRYRLMSPLDWTDPPTDPARCDDDECETCGPRCELCDEPCKDLDDDGVCPECRAKVLARRAATTGGAS